MAINKEHAARWAAQITYLAPYPAPNMRLNSEAREAFEAYAVAVGMRTSLVGRATNADLIGVYLVGRKDLNGAARTVRKVEASLGAPVGDPFAPAPEPAPAPREPLAEPAPEPAPGTPKSETVRDIIRDEVRSQVRDGLRPLETALAALDAETQARLATYEDQLAGTLQNLMAVVEQHAHNAAAEALKSMTPLTIDVTRPHEPAPVPLGLVHFKTPQIIAALKAGVNVYLHGPAGSGKTTMARKVADAFGLKLYFAAKVESEYQLLGFTDAKGEAVRTQFREAYEHGGVFLFDELDGSSASAVVALNAALANGVCPFPDGVVSRHPDFLCIAAGNTKLSGASRQYAGRNQLDGASIDRFAFIEFPYDDQLERALATDAKWCAYVQRVRKEVANRGLAHLVTPRATLDGCKLLASGLDWDTVADMCVFKGLDADTVEQIKRAAQ
jgi:hypothetical protein